ncbi:glycoside hydrolase family protein [Roseibium sp.]|uniref:glycoside hydrolase family protein n=1 Tax=Roseibium sp. TaxID=1936156 RepID=UPI003A96AF5E
MTITDKGLAFIAGHEGFVSKAYLDPAGVLTIGYGFTMRSRVFSSWWRTRHSTALRLGDRLTRFDANTLLRRLIEEEYAPPVVQRFKQLKPHQSDACISAVYNLGPRALRWKWAQALARGDVVEASRLLERTGTTAGGRKLPGLVRRRREEAQLLLSGKYPREAQAVDAVLQQTQKALASLGYAPGPADGRIGPRTTRAVMRFQRDTPPLAVDGVAGPATRAALHRTSSAQRDQLTSLGAGVGIILTAASADISPLIAVSVAAGVAVSILGLGLLWRRRGRLFAQG